MILLLLRHVPAVAFWLAKHGCVFFYRNANLQTLVLAPVILVLLLLPAVFSAGGKAAQTRSQHRDPSIGHAAAVYQPSAPWSFDK